MQSFLYDVMGMKQAYSAAILCSSKLIFKDMWQNVIGYSAPIVFYLEQAVAVCQFAFNYKFLLGSVFQSLY